MTMIRLRRYFINEISYIIGISNGRLMNFVGDYTRVTLPNRPSVRDDGYCITDELGRCPLIGILTVSRPDNFIFLPRLIAGEWINFGRIDCDDSTRWNASVSTTRSSDQLTAFRYISRILLIEKSRKCVRRGVRTVSGLAMIQSRNFVHPRGQVLA